MNYGSNPPSSTPSAVVNTRYVVERFRGCKSVAQRRASTGYSCCAGFNQRQRDFLTGSVVDVGDVRLPEAGADRRLRWDLHQLHSALNAHRRQQNLTWADLAGELDCTPARLTNLRSARFADMGLTMRITQWLGQPAAVFIHPAQW